MKNIYFRNDRKYGILTEKMKEEIKGVWKIRKKI